MFVEVTVYHLLKLTAISPELKDLCQRSRTEQENPYIYSHKRGKKTGESPFAAKERTSQSNRTEIHNEE